VSQVSLIYLAGRIFALPQSTFDTMMRDMTTTTEKHIKDVDNTSARNGVALSLWSGCLSAAEIALGTRDGPNTAESRMDILQISLTHSVK